MRSNQKLLIPVTNKHAPIKKITVKMVQSPWIDEKLKNCMVERDEPKGMAIRYDSPTDWQTYCKCINHVTKLNKNQIKLHYATRINYIKNDSKKLCVTFFQNRTQKQTRTRRVGRR
jgi:hypothetical protein